MSRGAVLVPAAPPGPAISRTAVEYYQPPNYLPPEADTTVLLAEQKLHTLQDEERRNRSRAKLLEDEAKTKAARVRQVTAQQDERRAHLQALDEELLRKQAIVKRLTLEVEDKAAQLQPLNGHHAARRQLLDALTAQQEEARRQLKRSEEEAAAKRRAIAALGDHSADKAQRQRASGELQEQQRSLRLELERGRRQADESHARAAHAEADAEVMMAQADRQQLQLRALEREHQEQRDVLDKLQMQWEDATAHHLEIFGKTQHLERDANWQRLELSVLEEEVGLKQRALEDLRAQCGGVGADVEAVQQDLHDLRSVEEVVRQNREMEAQLAALKQELAQSTASIADRDYKAQSLEAMIQRQRQRPEGRPFHTGSHLVTSDAGDPRQQLLQLLRRQEGRIARHQQDLADKEAVLRAAEGRALREQQQREAAENALRGTLADLHMERARRDALKRSTELQDLKVARHEMRLERSRQEDLLFLLSSNLQEASAAVPVDPRLAPPGATDAVRRQRQLIAQLQGSLPVGELHYSAGSSLVTPA